MDKNKETQDIIDNLTKGIEAAKDMRTVLQAQLEAEPKPKLRHGDIVVPDDNCNDRRYLAIEAPGSIDHLNIWGRKEDGTAYVNGTVRPDNTHYMRTGQNIFADLQALDGEPLEEFELHGSDIRVSFDKDGDLRIEQDEDIIIICGKKDKANFILNLRRMEAKLKA